MSIPKTFRDKKLPCDALIYLGTEFTPSGWNTRNGEFGWKKENFPDPERMIDEMHAQHFKVVLHIVIEGRRMSGTVSEPVYAGQRRAERPQCRGSLARGSQRRLLLARTTSRSTISASTAGGPTRAMASISRRGSSVIGCTGKVRSSGVRTSVRLRSTAMAPPGMQRYGAFLWSGDVQSRWETLKTHVPIAVNTGLSGIPYWGTDIGGFVPTAEYTGELHVRWFQFGAFCPSFRAHGRHWHLKLPWGWNGGDGGPKETNAFAPAPEELNNPQVEPILKKYLELRYRLMPYIYTAARETADTGMPMMRSMWLHHPDDPAAVARGDQFFWGRDLLVAPVVEKGATARKVYLPKGTWYDFWTAERIEGGREIERAVTSRDHPALRPCRCRHPDGARQAVRRRESRRPAHADGVSRAPTARRRSMKTMAGASTTGRASSCALAVTWRDAGRRLTLTLAPGSRMLPPGTRNLEVGPCGSDGRETGYIQRQTSRGKPVTHGERRLASRQRGRVRITFTLPLQGVSLVKLAW